MYLAIRADGGPEIGYGHLIRSNALSEEVLSRGHKVTLATTRPEPAQSVFPDSVAITELPSRGNPEPFVSWIDANQPDVVVTDSYPIDTDYQSAIRDRVPLVVIQDDARHTICADLFINGNLYATELDYEFVGSKPETCLGANYVLLRKEIRDWAEKEPPWRERPERALVIMGGSDIANLMPTAIRAFDGFDIHVDGIVGPGFSQSQEQSVRAAADEVDSNASVERDPDDLVERMFQADFAVSTSSSTTYELLGLGTPIISIPVVDNQEPIAQSLREHEGGIVLGRMPGNEEVQDAVFQYMSNIELREQHHIIGQKLVDGKGTVRVANKIENIV